jgi:uncharacterized membrane protein YhhN
MWTIGLSVLVFASAALTIRAKYRNADSQVYLFKPLTTFLILIIPWVDRRPTVPLYRALVSVGLGFSLAGDVFLMLPGDRIVPGMASFLVAHLCSLSAFSVDTGWVVSPWLLLPWIAYAIVLLAILLPHAGRLRVPVMLYGVAIAAMAWRALERWTLVGEGKALLAFAGATLFVLSDSALAINRFVRPFEAVHIVVLTTYYAAQWLIALSV